MRRNTKINVDYGFAKDNDGIKIADFIAYSARIFTKELKEKNKANYYHILDKYPPDWFFRVIFS